MKKELKDKHFIKKPQYPGGEKAMHEFLAKNKIYPAPALENHIEGTVTVRYSIDHTGKVIQTKVIGGIGYGCDEEAQRIVALLKFKVPKSRKVKVQYQKTIHIHFKIPETSITTKITYSLAPTKSDTGKTPSQSYSYQIKW